MQTAKSGFEMKKIGVFIFFFFFSLFLVAGILFAKDKSQPNPINPAAHRMSTYQHNILVFLVDDLQKPKPVLQSVWILFIYKSNPAVLTFLPIFNPEDQLSDTSLSDQTSSNNPFLRTDLKITSDNLLAQSYLDVLPREIYSWDNYFVVDQKGFSDLALFLENDTVGSQNWEILSGPEFETNILRLCGMFKNKSLESLLNYPFDESIPDHLISDLDLQSINSVWKLIASSENGPRCKVLPAQ